MALLTGQDPAGRSFRNHIRNYNSALAMTSVGRHLDDSLNNGRGPYTFKLHGELIHRAGSLLPEVDNPPVYSQLYIYDNAAALRYRTSNTHNAELKRDILATLQNMLHTLHPATQFYKQAFELTADMPLEQQCRIALRFQENCDRRRYLAPDATVKEIAVILPGDGDRPADTQDIVLYRKRGALQRIRDDHPLYPSLRYVLLFPTGQLGWFSKIPYHLLEDMPPEADNSRKYVSLDEYFRYRFHIRPHHIDSIHLFLSGNLFQEYVCEAWAVTEQKRLYQLKACQNQLRADVYNGLADAVATNANVDVRELGKRIILPSSFVGGTRNMQQHCQDAFAINRYFGGGDLFITMTANPKWPEITNNLLYNQTASDRPDLVVHVDAPRARQHARICAEGQLRAQSPMRRSTGPTGQWRGDARSSATSATQPIQLPTHSDHSPPPTARIGPKLGRNIEHWWYDRSPANWSAAIPRSPAITQDIYQWFQGSHSARGHSGLKQTTSQV